MKKWWERQKYLWMRYCIFDVLSNMQGKIKCSTTSRIYKYILQRNKHTPISSRQCRANEVQDTYIRAYSDHQNLWKITSIWIRFYQNEYKKEDFEMLTALIWLSFTQLTNKLDPSFSTEPTNPSMQSLRLTVTFGSFSNHSRAYQSQSRKRNKQKKGVSLGFRIDMCQNHPYQSKSSLQNWKRKSTRNEFGFVSSNNAMGRIRRLGDIRMMGIDEGENWPSIFTENLWESHRLLHHIRDLLIRHRRSLSQNQFQHENRNQNKNRIKHCSNSQYINHWNAM